MPNVSQCYVVSPDFIMPTLPASRQSICNTQHIRIPCSRIVDCVKKHSLTHSLRESNIAMQTSPIDRESSPQHLHLSLTFHYHVYPRVPPWWLAKKCPISYDASEWNMAMDHFTMVLWCLLVWPPGFWLPATQQLWDKILTYAHSGWGVGIPSSKCSTNPKYMPCYCHEMPLVTLSSQVALEKNYLCRATNQWCIAFITLFLQVLFPWWVNPPWWARQSEDYGMYCIHDVKQYDWTEIITGWWARATPLKNMSSSMGMMTATQYFWEILIDGNHSPPTRLY